MALPRRLADRKESKSSGKSVRISTSRRDMRSLMKVHPDAARAEIDLLEEVRHRGNEQLLAPFFGRHHHVVRSVPECLPHHAARPPFEIVHLATHQIRHVEL